MAEADCPGTTIAVDRGAWTNLSPEQAALVAPPVTVSSLPVTGPAAPRLDEAHGPDDAPRPDEAPQPDEAALAAVEHSSELLRQAQQARSRANMPVERHRRPTR